MSHYPDSETPIEEMLSAYADLIQEGKVLKIGASNYSAQQLEHALTVSATQGLPKYEICQRIIAWLNVNNMKPNIKHYVKTIN